MIKYFSILSIIIALIIIGLKIEFDISSYYIIKDTIAQSGDMQPTLVAGGKTIILTYLIPLLISFIFSVIGFKKQNKYRRIGLILNILTVVYTIIPIGVILSLTSFS